MTVQNPQSTVANSRETSTGSLAAELIFTIANRAPEVLLSFDGLHVPTELFAALHALGWGVPHVPPPPGSAIDWTPDPTTGMDYTLKSWMVNEFRLEQSTDWSSEVERTIGAETIRHLRRHGAAISGLRGGVEEDVPPEESARPSNSVKEEIKNVAVAAGSPFTVVLAPTELDAPDNVSSWTAKVGRKREAWSWHEGPPLDQETANSLTAQDAFVWTVKADPRSAPTSGTTLMQMICTDADSSKTIAKLGKLFGTPPLAVELSGFASAEGATLIVADVPTNSVEMIKSNVLLRFPKLILRH